VSVSSAVAQGNSPVMADGNDSLASIKGSQLRSPLKPLVPTATRLLQERRITGSPNELRLHRAFEEVDFKVFVDDISRAARMRDLCLPGLILATPKGTILAGIGHWWFAVCEGRADISWIEHPMDEADALQFILSHYQRSCGVNDFLRIRLALTHESCFAQKAHENMRAGGKHKGSTNLSMAGHIEVRRKIAELAGTGVGNVAKVKVILRSAHPNVVAAVQNGSLSIHRAWLWCKMSKSQQREEFARHEENCTESIISRELRSRHADVSLSNSAVIRAPRGLSNPLQGSVANRVSLGGRTRCQPWKGILQALDAPGTLNLHG